MDRPRLAASLAAALSLGPGVPAAAPPADVRVAAAVRTRSPDGVFRITPTRPLAELRAEARAAVPPGERDAFRPEELVELTQLAPSIRLEIRYATSENFLSTPVYEQARAFLQRPAAEALARVQRALQHSGFGLLVHDAYRPWWVTKLFWEATPVALRSFVANPAKGSRHNRGCAVDLTLYSLADGQAVEMPSLYDELSERASARYDGGTAEQRARRDLLRRSMEREGFRRLGSEWWHFDYVDWRHYPVLNLSFDEIRRP